MELNATVGNHNEAMPVKPGFEDFFGKIMSLVRNGEVNDELGEELSIWH